MPRLADYRLTGLQEEYKDLLLSWRNSDHIREQMFTDRLLTPEEHELWFRRVTQDKESVARVLLYNENPVGFVHFAHLDTRQNRCSWGFYIGEKNAPQGSGGIMGFLALDLIFREYRLRKLCSEVLACNERSLRYHRKLGFVEEGRLKEHFWRHDRFEDAVLLALFREQWADRQKALLTEWKNKQA